MDKKCIKTGDVFHFEKNFELLNYLFDKDYKGWMKTTYILTETSFLWMAYIDGSVRNGWKNEFVESGKLKESFVGNVLDLPNNIDGSFDYKTRLVFEKRKDRFIFRGVYKMVEEETKRFSRIYEKIADTTTLFDY